MTKKKISILLISLVILAGLAIITRNLMKSKGKSDSELIEFNIEDTASVDKIIITDKFDNTIELIRSADKTWTDKNGDCISQTNVAFILDAFKNIEFKGYLPDNSKTTMTNKMAAQNIKVEIFQDGDWVKTWYIGPASSDNYGQIMLLDDASYGKSQFPVLMQLKNVKGIIDPRFFADRRQWMCTNIFSLPVEKIKLVNVQFYDDPKKSFKVTRDGNKYNVYQFGKKLPNVNEAMIYRYLTSYGKIHYEMANFVFNDKQVDSVKHSKPFAALKVVETSGKSTDLRLFRMMTKDTLINDYGESVNYDNTHFWCELPDGELVKCQYFVFNPLLMGHVFFPLAYQPPIYTEEKK